MTIIANGYVECYTLSAEICKIILDENLLEYFRKKYHFNDFSIELKDLEFIKELGKGNYGYVNLVRSKRNKQYYAIKALELNQIKSVLPFDLKPGENLLPIIFLTSDYKVHYSLICKDSEKFCTSLFCSSIIIY